MGCVEGRPGSHRPLGMERGEVDEPGLARCKGRHGACSELPQTLLEVLADEVAVALV